MKGLKIPVYRNGQKIAEPLNLDTAIASAIQTEDNRYNQLERIEWQRWTPVVGVYRLIRDNVTGDQSRLNTTHSTAYETAVNMYNILQGSALFVGAVAGLQQLVEKFM